MIGNTFLVVLYNQLPNESATLTSILQNYSTPLSKQDKLIIWDNSNNSSIANFLKLEFHNIQAEYIHTPDNTSLSIIYNKVSENIKNKDYITLLDQDSNLPGDYFRELSELQTQGHPLILPIVVCNEKIVSPGHRFYSHGMLFDEITSGEIPSHNLLAINSGMSIRKSVFEKYNYDARLRFYGTDTYFMRMYEKYFEKAFVMSTKIDHSLAEMEDRDTTWKTNHLKEKLRTFHIIFNNSLDEKLFVKIHSYLLRKKHRI